MQKSSKNYFNVTPIIYELILRDILTKTQKKQKITKELKILKLKNLTKKNFSVLL